MYGIQKKLEKEEMLRTSIKNSFQDLSSKEEVSNGVKRKRNVRSKK